MTLLGMFSIGIIWIALIIDVFIEAGFATGILLTLLSIYSYVGIHGNSLYAYKLHDITSNLNDAIRLIQQRLK